MEWLTTGVNNTNIKIISYVNKKKRKRQKILQVITIAALDRNS
jgi:hypothetical protein